MTGPKMRIPSEVLPGLMPGNHRDFRNVEPVLEQSRYGLVSKIVEMQILDLTLIHSFDEKSAEIFSRRSEDAAFAAPQLALPLDDVPRVHELTPVGNYSHRHRDEVRA